MFYEQSGLLLLPHVHVQMRHAEVTPTSHALHKEIRTLSPWTMSWSNVGGMLSWQ